MASFSIAQNGLKELRKIDEKLVSYNVEMTEVTGGTFWKAYTQGQIDGTEIFPPITDFSNMQALMQWYDPIDLTEKNIIMLAKALGICYVRVSGTWATGTYYDFDGHTNGKIPEGYRAVLTKEQWTRLLDFVKAVGAKLMISVSNCAGNHEGGKPWTPEQAKLIFDYSIEYGVPINAAEFMNEPNALAVSGAPAGYTAEDFARDQDSFYRFVKENYPDVLLVGPSGAGDKVSEDAVPMTSACEMVSTDDLLALCKENSNVFSYHCYNGLSERGASIGHHWLPEEATTEPYFDVVKDTALYFAKIRDKFCPGAQMWVTESGDAGAGGNTWASTFLDVLRTVNELGVFATITDGIIFHNTFASSDYGYLDHATHLPRPNYWAVYLWNRLMGTTVYDSNIAITEGAHVYVHSRRDGKNGYAYAIINNSTTETTKVELPKAAEVYMLHADNVRSKEMKLNGKVLELTSEETIPEMKPVIVEQGTLELAPTTVAYVVL